MSKISNDVLQMWSVSKRVNSSRAPDDDPTLIKQADKIEFRKECLMSSRRSGDNPEGSNAMPD